MLSILFSAEMAIGSGHVINRLLMWVIIIILFIKGILQIKKGNKALGILMTVGSIVMAVAYIIVFYT